MTLEWHRDLTCSEISCLLCRLNTSFAPDVTKYNHGVLLVGTSCDDGIDERAFGVGAVGEALGTTVLGFPERGDEYVLGALFYQRTECFGKREVPADQEADCAESRGLLV